MTNLIDKLINDCVTQIQQWGLYIFVVYVEILLIFHLWCYCCQTLFESGGL